MYKNIDISTDIIIVHIRITPFTATVKRDYLIYSLFIYLLKVDKNRNPTNYLSSVISYSFNINIRN